MLRLSRGTVVEAGAGDGGMQELTVEVAGARRPATCDVALLGAAQVGDDVVVNVEAVALGLGSGGRDIVHVNLTRGLDGAGTAGAHVMKLNYSSLQHAVLPVEEGPDAGADPVPPSVPLERPVGVFGLHGQLPACAWAFAQASGGARLGYVQTAGGALPGGHSRVVRELLDAGLLCGHITAGPAYGGQAEAITTAEALHHGLITAGWDAALAGPGPGILGSASALGHGGLVALDTAHTALALGCPTVVVARMSDTDPRSRHRGLSHHTRTVLDLLLAPVTVAVPSGESVPAGRHTVVEHPADLAGFRGAGHATRSMGRDDDLFFAAALVAGHALADLRARA